jgi:hypothetical protein
VKRLAVIFLALATACGGGGTPAPDGWSAVPGGHDTWSKGAQRYSYTQISFSGTLQDLASAQTVNVVLRNHAARFIKSDVFHPCPGQAAVATFALGKTQTLEQGFAELPNDRAVLVTYVRPNGVPVDPAVTAAMQRALCVSPV